MFNTGVTDLAPELIGWYGAPGITIDDDGKNKYACGCAKTCQEGGLTLLSTTGNKTSRLPICEGEGTTVFLVGKNFSVHDTKIIAGGVCIPHTQLVSREIMRVTIPSCVNKVNVDGKEYVAVYAATPYGVANHLHIPVHARAATKETKELIAKTVEEEVKKQVAGLNLSPQDIEITPTDSANTKVILQARCVDKNTSLLHIEFVKAPKLTYSLAIPKLDTGGFQLHAALKKGQYLVPLSPVKTSVANAGFVESSEIESYLSAPILNDPDGDSVIDELSKPGKLTYADLADDGKDTLKMIFYLWTPTTAGSLPIRDWA